MKKSILAATILGAVFLMGVYGLKSMEPEEDPSLSFRWYDYLPSAGKKLLCYVPTLLARTLRSYLQAVTASVAIAGDPTAVTLWQDLLETYKPTELICLLGGESLDQVAAGISTVLPDIPGITWATRQALGTALYQALEKVRGQTEATEPREE